MRETRINKDDLPQDSDIKIETKNKKISKKPLLNVQKTVYFSKEEEKALDAVAEKLDISFTKLIRKTVLEYYEISKKK